MALFTLAASVGMAALPGVQGTPSTTLITTTRVHVMSTISAGSSDATAFFEFGTTTAYGTAVVSTHHAPAGSTNFPATTTLSGLQPGTTYHYRCSVSNTAGTTNGPDATFTTPEAPVITTGVASDITDLAAVLNGTIDAKGCSYTVYAYYGPTTAYGRSRNGTNIFGGGSQGTGTQPCTVEPSDLLPSTTYHYKLVAVDNFNVAYHGADATFTTAPASTPPTVGQAQAYTSDYHATIAQLYMSLLFSGSSSTTVSYEYGPTTAYGTTAAFPTTIAPNTRQDGFASLVNLSGLTPGTTYHFRGKATNAQGTVYTNDATFTLVPGGVAATGAVTGITDLGATLHGTVNPRGLAARVAFDLGPTTAYGNEISVGSTPAANTTTPYSLLLDSLLPDTTYHYRIKVVNIYNNEEAFYGADATFTTGPAATSPSVGPVIVSGILGTTALVDCGSVFSGSSATTVVFQYGPTTSYGTTVTDDVIVPPSSTQSASVTLTHLTPGTLYHVRVVATNNQGTHASADATFTTAPPAAPAIGIVSTTQVRTTAADVQAVNVTAGSSLATVEWEYGTTTAYGTTVPGNAPAHFLPGIFESTIPGGLVRRATGFFSGLQPGTTYHYRCRATNGEGSTTSPDATFTTSTGPALTTQPATAVTDLDAVLHGTATASAGALSSLVFEIGTTTAYGRIVGASSSLVAADATENITATVSGLFPETTYHYRLSVRDQEENVFTGADMTFTTGPAATAPTAVTQTPIALAAAGATLQAQVATGSSPATVVFEYGPTTAYGAQVTVATPLAPSQTLTVSGALPGLTPATTYHYRAVATNDEGTSTGADITFTTPALPTVTTSPATAVRATRATLNGAYHRQGGSYTVTFDYGETIAYGQTTPAVGLITLIGGGTGLPGLPIGGGGIIIGGGGGDAAQNTTSTIVVQPQTTYHYRLRLTDNYGNSYLGADATFTTSTPAEAWRKDHFGSTANEGDAADLANPSQDGIPNLMKYAMGADPDQTSTPPPITVQEHSGARYLSITFPRNPEAVDLTYEVEAADSPAGPWTIVATLPPGGQGTGPGFITEDIVTMLTLGGPPLIVSDTVRARDTVSMNAAQRRFLRLKVRRP